jgi:hypothetical protein
MTAIETRLAVLTWMVGAQIALTVPVVWLLLRVAGKLGAV